MLLAAIDSFGYRFFFVLHIIGIVYGIGSVSLNALRGMEAMKRQGEGGLAIAETIYSVSKKAEWFIYSIPITGFAMLGLSDDVWDIGQTWIWLSLVIYVLALGVSHGVLFPASKQSIEVQRRGGGPELEALGKKVASADMVLQVATVVLIVLMIWKPGA